MLELYSDTSIEISCDLQNLILHVDWKGYQSLNTGTQGCERILALMVRHNVHDILNDNTHARGLWMEPAQWAAKDWFPRMKQAGMKRFAWVYSPAKFSQLSTDAALALMDTTALGVEVFQDKDTALAWLRSPRSPSA